MAQRHNLQYVCYARPGAGNTEIAERVLSQLTDVEPAVYVIGWYWIDRFSYTIDHKDHELFWRSSWQSLMPIDTDSVSETYFKHLHSELRDKFTSLTGIKLVIDCLRQSGNRFIMTYMDDLLFDSKFNTTPAITMLQGICEPCMTRFDNKNFLDYSRHNGFEISATQHPLEAAHQSAAELIDSYNLL